jgi:hypothetical protein
MSTKVNGLQQSLARSGHGRGVKLFACYRYSYRFAPLAQCFRCSDHPHRFVSAGARRWMLALARGKSTH